MKKFKVVGQETNNGEPPNPRINEIQIATSRQHTSHRFAPRNDVIIITDTRGVLNSPNIYVGINLKRLCLTVSKPAAQ
jgi:hypothetical protein